MKSHYLFTSLLLILSISIQAQENEPTGPSHIGTMTMQYVPSIASQGELLPSREKVGGQIEDGRAFPHKVLIGKDPQIEDDYFVRNAHQLTQSIPGRQPDLVFDAYSSASQPTDPDLAVGPDHVVVTFNTGFRIFDKEGNPLTGQIAPNPTIFPNGGCCDLTVSYDSAADRWVISFLGGGAQIAVSDGPDPVNDGWFNYNIPQINDYQKLSVWSDGYYMTDNTGSNNKVWALERDAMLAGDASAQIIGFNLPGIVTSGFYSPQALNVTNNDMPSAGNATFVYLQDDAWAGVSEDHIKLWSLTVDWDTPGNSVMSAPVQLTTTPFISVFDGGSFSNLTQPSGGIAIDALQATIMNQAQFRKFGSHNSAVFNFVVDTDATAGELAGVRWFELRQDADGDPWTIHQEGTHVSTDGKHAWHASLMMDASGNIGMGYSAMAGPTTPNPTDFRVSSYYTGRFANDPLGTMTISEELIAAGNANIPGLRYGDYNKIDIDPDDDKTFWFINEYMNSGRKGVVGRFKIAPDFNDDLGVVAINTPVDGALTNNEEVEITLFNFGLDTQTNIPVSLTLDGTVIANEVVAGPLESSNSINYTFTATLDLSNEGQTYEIVASANLSGDEDSSNDSTTKNVTHIFANDIGVSEITSPENGEGLGNEPVTIVVENFGTASASNFDVSYSINGGTAVVETVNTTVNPGSSINYTFNALADISNPGTYEFESSTLLGSDSDNSNDSLTKTVVNLSCSSETISPNTPIGPNAGAVNSSVITFTEDFIVNDVNVTINATHSWVGDLDIKLVGPDNTEVVLFDRHGGSGDNLTNTTFDDEAATPIASGTPPYSGTFRPDGSLADFSGINSAGDWTLVITDNAGGDGGTLIDWTLQLCGDPNLSIGDNNLDGTELLIISKGNRLFDVLLPTTTDYDRLNITVHNMLGQKLFSNVLKNVDGTGYKYELDMSYAATGVYLVRIGNKEIGSVKRIIVK